MIDFDAVGGADLFWSDMHRIVGLTEKVVLALLGAQISYLTDVPWTAWREPW
jgi:hypothetical protein